MRKVRDSKESWEGESGQAHFPFQLGTDVLIKDVPTAQAPSVPRPSPGLINNRPRAAQWAGNVFHLHAQILPALDWVPTDWLP